MYLTVALLVMIIGCIATAHMARRAYRDPKRSHYKTPTEKATDILIPGFVASVFGAAIWPISLPLGLTAGILYFGYKRLMQWVVK